MTEENQSSWTATFPSATLSTINLASTGLGSNSGFRGERLATCGQSYGRPVQDSCRTMIFETRRQNRSPVQPQCSGDWQLWRLPGQPMSLAVRPSEPLQTRCNMDRASSMTPSTPRCHHIFAWLCTMVLTNWTSRSQKTEAKANKTLAKGYNNLHFS